MKARFISVAAVILVLTAVLALVIPSSHTEAQGGTVKPRPLTSATPDEVAQLALNYTQVQFKVLSGTPQVLLAKPVTSKELPSLGIGGLDYLASDEPLMLVIVKGDLDVSNMYGHSPSDPAWRAGYIAYLYDLRAGVPTATLTSPNGGRFRAALNDPTLPEDEPLPPSQNEGIAPASAPQIAPPTPVPPLGEKMPYGAVAPPLTPPATGGK